MSSTADLEATEHSELIGRVLADRYRIDALLGLGGMGAVYRAEHVHMRKVVAIKILHREMTASPEIVKRFEREAIAAGQIAHPNVASASDFGRLDDGSFYLVLEFVPGQSLSTVLKNSGALPVERAVPIARQIISALGAAHAVGIVHRDLKPDNVMLLEKEGAKDFVKVLDFGIAKVPISEQGQTQLTQMGAIFGTPQYMAPEQASGAAIDVRADLYAFGLVLHEMLTGKTTFDAEDLVVLLTMQLSAPPPPLPDNVPEALKALVSQLLQKEREQRPSSADEVVARLDEIVAPPRTRLASQASISSSIADTTQGTSALHATVLAEPAPPAQPAAQAYRQKFEYFIAEAKRLGRKRQIANLPNWMFAAGGLLVALISISIVVSSKGGDDHVEGASPAALKGDSERAGAETDEELDGDETSTAAHQVLDPEYAKTVELARLGGDAAIGTIERQHPDKRSESEWLALAQGYLRASRRGKTLERVQQSLNAYRELLEINKRQSSNQLMLTGLRYYAGKPETADLILQFAAEHMGADGADLLFDIWSKTSLKTPTTERAGELLNSRSVKRNMSEALRLALELREAKSCEEIKDMLPRIEQRADRRSVLPLREFAKTTGCGENKRKDCYPCLREGQEFRNALAQAEMRKTPLFNRRFR